MVKGKVIEIEDRKRRNNNIIIRISEKEKEYNYMELISELIIGNTTLVIIGKNHL